MLLHRAVETVRTNLGLDSAVWFRVLGGLFVLFILWSAAHDLQPDVLLHCSHREKAT